MTTDSTNFTLNDIVSAAIELKVSDIHIHTDQLVYFRIDGTLSPVGSAVITSSWIEQNIISLLSNSLQEEFKRTGTVEAGLSLQNYRLRVSLGNEYSGLFTVLRLLPPKVPTPAELSIPEVAVNLMARPQGIVLIAGATGSGKSTTCASLLQSLTRTRPGCHVLTLEDPIEYTLPSGPVLVTQRELHSHYDSFSDGMHTGLRQDPDVIFIGELRDRQSATAAISAAGSGHLVLATLHSYDSVSAINTLLWLAGVEDKPEVRSQVSYTLLGVLAQRLVRLEESSRVAAFEIIVNTPAVSKLIAKPDGLEELSTEVEVGVRSGHVPLEDSLAQLVVSGRVSEKTAAAAASDVKLLRTRVRYHQTLAED